MITRVAKFKDKMRETSVLDMRANQARTFFLKSESYCSLDLPPYFDFGTIIKAINKKFNDAPPALRPEKSRGANYIIYSNKDGRFAWRPFQLIHPVIYVDLVRRITEPNAWAKIKERFKKFGRDEKIRCLSIPQESRTKQKDQAAQIYHWWQGIEQKSIELALDFNYMYHADISDCYASIYTHSVAWAVHGKKKAKDKRRDKSMIGNVIDKRLQSMQDGQTNGIPQGSVLMDMIAELILGYADLKVSKCLEKEKITDFIILRYRDDYRIFVNDSQAGETILKVLTEVLIGLGLRLNASKTTNALPIIEAAIKDDKRAWLRSRQRDKNLQKHLLLIHAHGIDYPNAGSLIVALDEFHKRMRTRKKVQNPVQLISIAIDIGYASPRCFPVCAAIVSKLLSMLSTKGEKLDTLGRIRRRLAQLPNSGHLEAWLQRISYPFDATIPYTGKLCKLVAGDQVDLWDNQWISDVNLRKAVDSSSIGKPPFFVPGAMLVPAPVQG
ncbi:MAG: RNA-directed DNA polymerase [Chloroflexi bacterium]|nr:MAG: RNA-directed DNA polymerase [Chloroflexota bacterium]